MRLLFYCYRSLRHYFSNSTLSQISFFFLAYNDDYHARIIDVGKKAEVGWEDDAYVQEFTTESGFDLKPGATKEFTLEAAKKTISGYNAIVSSYKTSNGKEVLNSNAFEWYKNAYTNKVVDNSSIFTRLSAINTEKIDGLIKDDRGAVTLDATVLFDFDSSTLSADGKESLKKVIDAYVKSISAKDGTILIKKITVEGHTDPDGTREHNQKLSEDRATTVMNYCVSQHPKLKDVMEIKGCADDNPVKKSDGSVDKAASRRVCFVAE